MNSLDEYLRDAEQAHGHLCAGQVLGVRLAMLGLAKLGIDDPRCRARVRLHDRECLAQVDAQCACLVRTDHQLAADLLVDAEQRQQPEHLLGCMVRLGAAAE